jgi:DNA-binding NtrC family response regulator
MNRRTAVSSNTSQGIARRTVLLVEDEPFVREVTRSVLESRGFEVFAAEDVVDAVSVYEGCKRLIDLVMTDMVLPGGTGQELGRELQRRSPEVDVLVTSGYSDAGADIEEPASRMYFLAKPYSRQSLVAKIEEILGSIPLQRAIGQAG